MKTILFVTTNARKLAEAQAGCEPYGIIVKAANYDVDEIQSDDFSKIAMRKAADAYALAQAPIVVNDTAWNMPALRGFPGAYMKEAQYWFEAEDFAKIVEGKDRRICMVETVAYTDGITQKVFTMEFWGGNYYYAKGPRIINRTNCGL